MARGTIALHRDASEGGISSTRSDLVTAKSTANRENISAVSLVRHFMVSVYV
jgi:hypothetical protein